ncbi:hypothetical protein R0L47_04885 [Pectobacterium polonicum]|uniref:Uncharacterized protein n=1 Tax=Pectobacterium polonicum TaxID=2485124 RepID=A0AAE9NWI0_9GAMM|nr:hypothetical protein [Pectobacterium polonicum]TKY80852.1 hypothetical protein EDI29_19160 [Pectobacterium polonicum]UVO10081.1 hypothetical protein LW347_09135 [Pectobacterium polonicum]GKW22839.1 hypothetical protein PEC311524_04330 [Pectobacterium carotovorum subsp. carotovorum]
MKNHLRFWLLGWVLVLPAMVVVADATAATTRKAEIKYSVYGGEALTKVAQEWNATFPDFVGKGGTQNGSFPMYNAYSQYSTSVTYRNTSGEICKFTAGYVLNSTGPTFSSSAEKITPNAYCSISIYPRYSQPYEFTMNISMY